MTVEEKAAGKVVTGFSYPYVAKYAASGGNLSYTEGRELARGVSVSSDITVSDPNQFYTNNQVSESGPQRFTEGTVTLNVDGLWNSAKKFIMGTPEPGEDGWTDVGDDTEPPYVGLGYIVRYMSGGVESFQPYLYPRVKFNQIGADDAATQEDEIDWQTKELSASIYRAENKKHSWQIFGSEYATEEEAIAELKKKLNIVEADSLSNKTE